MVSLRQRHVRSGNWWLAWDSDTYDLVVDKLAWDSDTYDLVVDEGVPDTFHGDEERQPIPPRESRLDRFLGGRKLDLPIPIGL